MGRCRFSPAAALFFAVLGPVIRAAWFSRLSRLVAVVAAVAGARDWWRWWRRWQVAVAGGWWLVAEVAGSRERWLKVAEVAENGRNCGRQLLAARLC
jgi:hypothetical protein